jgi:hypothetical protein
MERGCRCEVGVWIGADRQPEARQCIRHAGLGRLDFGLGVGEVGLGGEHVAAHDHTLLVQGLGVLHRRARGAARLARGGQQFARGEDALVAVQHFEGKLVAGEALACCGGALLRFGLMEAREIAAAGEQGHVEHHAGVVVGEIAGPVQRVGPDVAGSGRAGELGQAEVVEGRALLRELVAEDAQGVIAVCGLKLQRQLGQRPAARAGDGAGCGLFVGTGRDGVRVVRQCAFERLLEVERGRTCA